MKNDMNRRSFLGGVSTLAIAGAITGAPMPALAVTQEPTQGGTLSMLINPEPTMLLNLTTTGGSERKLSPKVTEGLLCYDLDLTPQPQLATEWALDDTGTRYTFKLREGVTWHDGEPFTSQDVATSIMLLKENHPRGRTVFANVETVETPDTHTAVIVLSLPAPYLIYALAASESPIVAHHLYGEGDPRENSANVAPIGTGPYRFVEWVRGSHAVFEPNPDYWDEGKPHLETLIARFISDAGARVAAFETGELDLGGDNPVPLPELSRLAEMENLEITTDGYSYNANGRRLEINLEDEYLGNLTVRQALAHAIDRQQILDIVYLGHGAVVHSPISPMLARFHTDDIEHYAFDPARAEALLDEAGYPRGEDDIRFSLTLDFNPYGPDYGAVANVLRSAFQNIGIETTVRAQDFPTYVKRIFTDRDFSFHVTGMSNLFDPTVGVQRIYWSKNFRPGVPFSNASKYNNPQVDKLLEDASVEVDEAKRREMFVEMQKITAIEIPNINLVTIKENTVSNKRVRAHSVTADGLNGNLSDVFIAS